MAENEQSGSNATVPPDSEIEKSKNESDITLLQIKETELKIEKLEKECKFLDYQTSQKFIKFEVLKALSGIGSVLAAFFTLGTILFSIIKWSNESEETRIAASENRFNNQIISLQDEQPQKRLNAAIALKTYINKKDKNRNAQILLSFVNALAFEENEITRNGIVDIIHSIDFALYDSATLKNSFISLINANRSLCFSGKYEFPIEPKEKYIRNRLQGLSRAVEVFTKKGIYTTDMSGIALFDVDFSNVVFSPGTDFSRSLIKVTMFINATCVNCNFQNANLNNVWFKKANLEGSKFDMTHSNSVKYIYENVTLFDGYHIGVLFDSANLKNTSFNHYPFYYLDFMSNALPDRKIKNSTFRNVNLENAIFLPNFYSVIKKNKDIFSKDGMFRNQNYNDSVIIRTFFTNPNTWYVNDETNRTKIYEEIKSFFTPINRTNTKLPMVIQMALND